jgi:hypothetical protein
MEIIVIVNLNYNYVWPDCISVFCFRMAILSTWHMMIVIYSDHNMFIVKTFVLTCAIFGSTGDRSIDINSAGNTRS